MIEYEVLWSRDALAHMEQVRAYLAAEASAQAATSVLTNIWERATVLQTFPLGFPRYTTGRGARDDERSMIVGSYRIVYEVDRQRTLVVVTAVLHTHRDT